ncbi:MAG: BamA/TamA family outer membrane protein [Sandaracinaceae bacterium]
MGFHVAAPQDPEARETPERDATTSGALARATLPRVGLEAPPLAEAPAAGGDPSVAVSAPVQGAPAPLLGTMASTPLSSVAESDVLLHDFEELFAAEPDDEGGDLGGFMKDWLLLPIVLYAPETQVIIALTGAAFFNFEDRAVNRPSSIRALGLVSTMGQLQINVEDELWIDRNRWRVANAFEYRDWPAVFYGLGNFTLVENQESFSYRRVSVRTEIDYRVWRHLYVGLRHDFATYELTKTEPDGVLTQGTIPGADGGPTSGVGWNVSWDDRDSAMYATRGAYLSVSGLLYQGWLGSRYDFGTLSVDLRKFFVPWLDHVVAIQLRGDFTVGDVPFLYMPGLGGSKLLRGHFRDRYRDYNVLAAQAEYRMPLFWRFKAVLYSGVAQVAPHFRYFNLEHLRYGVGAGLRFALSETNPAHMRIDVGYAESSFRFYLQVFESF